MSSRIADEQETLGMMLLSRAAIAKTIDVLEVDGFRNPTHRLIYSCIHDLYRRGQPADPITVTIELDRRGDLFSAGGAAYLHTLVSCVPDEWYRSHFREVP